MNEDEARQRAMHMIAEGHAAGRSSIDIVDAMERAGLRIVPAAKPACATEARGVYLGDDRR
jgi:hypothetical protein